MGHDHNEKGRHFLRMFEEGKQFTAELLRENENLRVVNLNLKNRIHELEKKYVQVSIPQLQERLGVVERERDEAVHELRRLRRELEQVETQNREFAERYTRIERQNGNLAGLYVASYNLHATLRFSDVVRCIQEIVINLVGSEMFGLYVFSDDDDILTLLAHEGLEDVRFEHHETTGIVGESLHSGEVVMAGAERRAGEPLVSIPLKVDDVELGVLLIFGLLGHKAGFDDSDREMLELLAGHAATALYSSKLYAESARQLGPFRSFADLLG